MSGGRYQVGVARAEGVLRWPLIDTHFGNGTVALFRSACQARECARVFNEPFFRRPPVVRSVVRSEPHDSEGA